MTDKALAFKKRNLAGQCRAMRCKVTEDLTEFDRADAPAVLLCAPHWHTAMADANAAATEKPPAVEVLPEGVAAQTAVVVDHAPVLALVEPIRAKHVDMAAQLVDLKIESQEAVDFASKLLKQVKGAQKSIETARKTITQPMLEAKAEVDALHRPAKDACQAVEGILKKAITAYVDGQAAAQVAALEAGKHEAALAVVQPELPSGVSTRTTWRWSITNPGLVPREYWVIDAAKIQAHVSTHKGQSTIPGVKVFPETGISAASK